MTTRGPAPVALMVVPPGTVRPEPLAAAVRELHPTWHVAAVWAGDPQLRPVLGDDLAWFDADGETFVSRQVQLASRAPLDALWLRALAATRRAIDQGAPSVVVLMAGAVAVLGSLEALVPPVGAPAVLVPRTSGPVADDGRSPGEAELVAGGSWSPHVAGLSSHDLLAWMERRLETGPVEGSIGRVLDRAALAFGTAACTDPAIGVGEWRWDVDAPSLLDLPSFDPERPWVLDPERGRRARIDVAAHPVRAAALARAAGQLAGELERVTLPGGLVVDDVIRGLVSDDDTCPAPWSEPAAFRTWLEPLYWSALHASRRDLAAAFPTPRGGDAERFRTWCRRAFVDDRAAVVLGVPPEPDDRWATADTLATDGVNLVGYLTRESSLGDVARRIGQGLADAGIAVSPLAYQRTASPHVDGAVRSAGVITRSNSVAVVNADQFPALAMDHPELFAAGTHLVGYWFWELEHVPTQMRNAATMVDEIWVGSQFVADAFRAAVDTPVRHVPIPVPAPVVSVRDRASFPTSASRNARTPSARSRPSAGHSPPTRDRCWW
jgi:hypothetical protein